jgi:hypothetical protein
VSPLSGNYEPERLSASETSQSLEQADILGPLVDWREKGHRVERAGEETIDGRKAYKLKVTRSSGAVHVDYLDSESALLVRREMTRTVAGRSVEVESTFGDFRTVGGVSFPHSIRSGAKGRPDVLHLVVEEVELNVPVDDARFELPGE